MFRFMAFLVVLMLFITICRFVWKGWLKNALAKQDEVKEEDDIWNLDEEKDIEDETPNQQP